MDPKAFAKYTAGASRGALSPLPIRKIFTAPNPKEIESISQRLLTGTEGLQQRQDLLARLGKFARAGHAEATPHIGNVLERDKDFIVRQQAANWLGLIGHPVGIKHLAEGLTDSNAGVRQISAKSLLMVLENSRRPGKAELREHPSLKGWNSVRPFLTAADPLEVHRDAIRLAINPTNWHALKHPKTARLEVIRIRRRYGLA